MYTPTQFRTEDLHWLDWLAAHDAFGTLISQVEGAPFATHLPVSYRREDSRIILCGHWARPNPQWHDIEGQRVLFIFHGPHAYISPTWYTDPEKQVPTWNYAVAHIYGRVRLIQDAPALQTVVTNLARFYEADNPAPWRFEDAEPSNQQRLRGIVGFELSADDVQIKLKLNQNHTAANVQGVISGLQARSSADERAVADLMQTMLEKR